MGSSTVFFKIVIVILGPLLSKCVEQHAPMDLFDDEEAILKHKGLRAVQGGKIKTKMADEYSGCVSARVSCFIMGKGDRCAVFRCKNV